MEPAQHSVGGVGRADWPVVPETVCAFASWCDLEKGLQSSTIKSYVGSLSQIQQLQNLPPIFISRIPRLRAFLKGAANAPRSGRRHRASRRAVSVALLRLLRHHLIISAYPPHQKRLFWAACVASFFGSLRMGDLLSPSVSLGHAACIGATSGLRTRRPYVVSGQPRRRTQAGTW